MLTFRSIGVILAMTIMGAPGLFAQDLVAGRFPKMDFAWWDCGCGVAVGGAGLLWVLESGGNRSTAASATNAMMGVVEPMMKWDWRDLFAIVYDAKAKSLWAETRAAVLRRPDD